MLNGLDLFSGIGGLTIALAPWVRPVAYCDNDRYATATLLSRMATGELPRAPIWDDVQTLRGNALAEVDIIYGGFPCQDISTAGRGAGLEGKRSGLFFEIMRLVDEVRPSFIFLENVPAITTRGLGTVAAEITMRGYDCRWTTLSAAEVGAPHLRKRWWLLAYTTSERSKTSRAWESVPCGQGVADADQQSEGGLPKREEATFSQPSIASKSFCHSASKGLSHRINGKVGRSKPIKKFERSDWWAVEPDVGRVAHGIPARVDRLRGLGNAVVPLCARAAFKKLSGLTEMRK